MGHPYIRCLPTRFISDFLHTNARKCAARGHACDMTSARSLLVGPDSPSFYDRISLCVSRTWLCGIDQYDGKS